MLDNHKNSSQGRRQRCSVAGGLETRLNVRERALVEETGINTAENLQLGDATGVNPGSFGKQQPPHRSVFQGGGDIVETHRRSGGVRSDVRVPTSSVEDGLGGPRDRAHTVNTVSLRQLDVGTVSLPASTDDVSDDAQQVEEWSAQFRDKRLAEHDSRRDALLRELLSPTSDGGDVPTTMTAGEENGRTVASSPVRRCHSAAGAVPPTKRGTDRIRYRTGRCEESGVGATLGEFKTSVGLSAKGDLFDDLFCRPSRLDEALTTEPGRRTPQQASWNSKRVLARCSYLRKPSES